MMPTMDPERVRAIRADARRAISRDWEDDGVLVEAPSPNAVISFCYGWLAMYELIEELAKRKCEGPDADYLAACAALGGLPFKPPGKCLPCRARKLLEKEEK